MNNSRSKKINRVKPVYPYLIIKRHWLKILILGIITFISLYPLVSKSKNVYYETTGTIKIEPVLDEIVSTKLNSQSNSIVAYYEQFTNTQILKLLSDEVIKGAIKKVGNDYFTGFSKDVKSNTISLFSKNGIISVGIESVKGTQYIKLVAKSSTGQKLDVVTNSLMESYIEKINSENEKIYAQKLSYLEKEKGKLENMLSKNMLLLQSYIGETGTGSFADSDIPYNVQIKNFESAYVDIYRKRVENEKKYSEVVQMNKKIKDKFGTANAGDESIDTAYYTGRKIVLLEEVDKINKEIESLSNENPKREELENKVNSMVTEIKSLDKEKEEKIKKLSDYKMDYAVLDANKDYQASLKEEKQIVGTLGKTRSKYAEISKKVLEAKGLSENIDNDKVSLEKLKEKISELKSESVTLNRIFISENASKTLNPAGNDFKKRLAILFVFSFSWIAIICFLYDIINTRIKSVDDIQNAIGIQPSWPISNLLNGNFATISIDEPNNTINKAIRSLSVRLDKEREKYDAKLVVFTGVESKGGVTEIILNSAHMMSKNCGKVLLIELNFDNPSLQEKLGIEGALGLKEILEGQALKDVVYFDKTRNIDVLFLNKTIALDNKDITTILEKAKNEYEFIYIDTAPVLSSDITEYLILKADIGILVVHGNRTKYKNMIHSVEIIDRLEINSFGIVLNWGKGGKKNG